MYYLTTNELYHHGVKGMKWGVRRYQNADGSLTDAGKKRLAKTVANNVDYMDTARWNQKRKKFEKTEKIPDPFQKRVGDIPEIQAAYKNLSSARDEYNKSLEFAKRFNDDGDLVKKYQEKAAREAYEKYGNSPHKGTVEDWIHAYQYDDADQGYDNSFSLYCRDKGVDIRKYESNVSEAYYKYRSACKQVTETMLGEYGNEVVHSRSVLGNKIDTTVSNIVETALKELMANEHFETNRYIPI